MVFWSPSGTAKHDYQGLTEADAFSPATLHLAEEGTALYKTFLSKCRPSPTGTQQRYVGTYDSRSLKDFCMLLGGSTKIFPRSCTQLDDVT
eukprot:544617-Rhodomonas_salina.1